ncbi:carnitine O-acetyltransferase [Drosophila guanche]|uniref:Blast:Carnitine O-acetyltransferase n=1 Tax=Drosophila guanche TaxID=7266 RepID=A0A3B0JMI4_DROGU|nr:carnitine O-acetyltransferase [Drosophila guanche]SPP82063.1 blast:Carnitine O-acetyltransferase [Drosophila guanche]
MRALLKGERYLNLFRNYQRFYSRNKIMLPHKCLYEPARKAIQSESEQSFKITASHRPFSWKALPVQNPDLISRICSVRGASGKCKDPPNDPPKERPPSFCKPTQSEPPCSKDPTPGEKAAPFRQSKPPPINKECKNTEEKLPCPKKEPRKEKKKPKDAATEDLAPKATVPKDAASKPTAPKDSAPKATAVAPSKTAHPNDASHKTSAIPPPPPPPPAGVPVNKPTSQAPPVRAEPSSSKPPPPPPPPPPARKIPPAMPPPAATQPAITQYKSAMPTSPSPCEKPPKPKDGEKKPEVPPKKESSPKVKKEKPKEVPNPCMLAFMERNRLGGKKPPRGGCYAGTSSPKEGTRSGGKAAPKKGPSSGGKPSAKEGQGKPSSKEGQSKSSPKARPTAGGKPAAKEGASSGGKPSAKGPASPSGKSSGTGSVSPARKTASSPTVSKKMATAASVQPKVTAPPSPPPQPKAKTTTTQPPPPPAPSVKPSPSQSTQAGGDQSHCEANTSQLLCQQVVPLKDTIQRYLCSLQPHLKPDEFLEEYKLTIEFQDGEGAQLQKLLEDVAKCSTNWLTPRWTNAAYLGYRAPVTIFSSPCLTLPMQKFETNRDYMLYTAKVIYGMCEFKELVDNNGIPVVKMCCHDLDNSQFRKIFGTVRKPGRFCDTIEQYSESQYVVVIHRNNFFKLPVYGADCKIAHVHNLADQLGSILHCPMERGEPIGLLTHDNRDNWGEAYTYLCGSEGNNESIVHSIEQSLFIVCLDDRVEVPENGASAVHAAQLLHGGGWHQNSANRWMDKTIQLIVNPNGMAGFCYEHAPADCQPLAMLMDYVQGKITQPNYGCQCCSNSKLQAATVLCFDPLNQCTDLFLCEAKRNIDKICSRLQLHVFKYECHGKEFIKAQGLNADSYIQMALQLAYYYLHGEMPAQYESAHLLMFEEGRTETVRSTSRESSAFVKSMTCRPGTNNSRLLALRTAVDSHQELTKLALQGQGIDRHLLGLQQMAKENGLPMPKFFQSKGFVKSVSFQVFSSQVPSRYEAFMAYGPLIANGYGCCYNPRNKDMIFSISAWGSNKETDPVQYGNAIEKALNTMRRLILQTGGDRVGENVCKCADETPTK